MRWAWWIVRDDGDRCGGPFDTREEAERIWRNVYDTSEYRVDYQYGSTTPDWERPEEDPAAVETLKAAYRRHFGTKPT